MELPKAQPTAELGEKALELAKAIQDASGTGPFRKSHLERLSRLEERFERMEEVVERLVPGSLLSRQQVAQVLGISLRTVDRRIASKELPKGRMVAGQLRWSLKDVVPL